MPHSEPHTQNAATPRATWRTYLPCVWLALVVVAAFPVLAIYGYMQYEFAGLLAAISAGLVCLLGSEIALLLTIWSYGSDQKIQSVLLGIFFRTGIPLVFGMLTYMTGGPLAEAGLFGMILVYYLLTLAVETILAVHLVSQTSSYKKAV